MWAEKYAFLGARAWVPKVWLLGPVQDLEPVSEWGAQAQAVRRGAFRGLQLEVVPRVVALPPVLALPLPRVAVAARKWAVRRVLL